MKLKCKIGEFLSSTYGFNSRLKAKFIERGGKEAAVAVLKPGDEKTCLVVSIAPHEMNLYRYREKHRWYLTTLYSKWVAWIEED